MKSKSKFRHELKYEINYGKYLALKNRIKPIMSLDKYAQEDGGYRIQSIYFDNYDDKALREKLYGMQKHEKFRLRYYNDDLSNGKLEKKIKYNGLCLKYNARLTPAETADLLGGKTDWMLNHAEPLVQELYCQMQCQILRPQVLVSYFREPYIYKAGNVRVTFDSDIRTTLFHRDFLVDSPAFMETAEEKGSMLLEIKYDNYLPEVIAHVVQSDGIRQQSFSKYAAARRFG